MTRIVACIPDCARGSLRGFGADNHFRWQTAAYMEDNASMKTVTPKHVKKATIKNAVKQNPKPKKKLQKKDPATITAKIGAISAAKRKLNREFFSEMARKSHGPDSARDGYHGGRKKKDA